MKSQNVDFNVQQPWTKEVASKNYHSSYYWPKISIVTPSFNQGQYIEETILSILNQGYPNLEYIIIDGGSSDITIQIINKYKDQITYWVSEKDNGQADAINKGLKQCTGEIFNWINSDDLLAEGALFKLANIWRGNKYDVIAGSCLNFQTDTRQIISTHHNTNLSLSDLLACRDDFHQPGLWFNLTFIKQNMLWLNSSYHYSFDRIWLLSMFNTLTPNILYHQGEFALFRVHKNSKTSSNWVTAEIELVEFLENFSLDKGKILERKKKKLIHKLRCQIATRDLFFNTQKSVLPLASKINIIIKHPTLVFNRFFLGAMKRKITYWSIKTFTLFKRISIG